MSNPPQDDPPDTSAPCSERQAELEAAFERQKDTEAPYKHVALRTLGELQWVLDQRHWSGSYDNGQTAGLTPGMQRANLMGVDLSGANLNGTQLREANLRGCNLRGAILCGLDLYHANLSGARLGAANLSDADLGGANLRGADAVAGNLLRVRFIGANLSEANLQGANLSEANLWRANLGRANLSGANLRRADLEDAILSSATLRAANLRHVSLKSAKLKGADFTGADLSAADLEHVNVTNTEFADCQLSETNFQHFHGVPHWPDLSPQDWQLLLQEVTAVTTATERLQALAWQWPGVLVHEQIAANPNTPAATLISLAPRAPLAFLHNPVVPLLFLENPLWLPAESAQRFLQALEARSVESTPDNEVMLQLIQRCAQAYE